MCGIGWTGIVCPSSYAEELSMQSVIAVGFGEASVTRDGMVIYEEMDRAEDDYWDVLRAEEVAARDPEHDWRIVLNGPFRGATFQRQSTAAGFKWIKIASNPGFG